MRKLFTLESTLIYSLCAAVLVLSAILVKVSTALDHAGDKIVSLQGEYHAATVRAKAYEYEAKSYSDQLQFKQEKEQEAYIKRTLAGDDTAIAELKRQMEMLERLRTIKAKYGDNPADKAADKVVDAFVHNVVMGTADNKAMGLPGMRDSWYPRTSTRDSTITALAGGVHIGTRMPPSGPAPK